MKEKKNPDNEAKCLRGGSESLKPEKVSPFPSVVFFTDQAMG
jgi:hypothetical protein